MHAVHDRIQPKGTTLCGHYCLYYAYSRCEGMSVQKIVHTMPSPQWIKSCIPILFDIPDIISEYWYKAQPHYALLSYPFCNMAART